MTDGSQHGAFDQLAPEDQRVLDLLVEAGFDEAALAGLPAEEKVRGRRLLSLFGLLRDYPVQDADDTLVHATLARIGRAERERAQRMVIDRPPTLQAPGLRLPNLVAVAAVVLIGASIVLPVLHNLRQQGLMLKSQNNLRYVMQAVDSYAGDYGTIPAVRAGLSDTVSAVTDAINLTPLVQSDYCRLTEPTPERQALIDRWGRDNMVLFLGIDNPVMEALRSGRSPQIKLMTAEGARRNLLQDDSAILWLDRARVMPETVFWRPRLILKLSDDIRPDMPAD